MFKTLKPKIPVSKKTKVAANFFLSREIKRIEVIIKI